MAGFRIAFKVPRGFEDIALCDIQRWLVNRGDSGSSSVPADIDVTAALDSGFVHVQAASREQLRLCLTIYDEGALWCVTACILVVGGSPISIPLALLDALKSDRLSLPSKRSRIIRSDGDKILSTRKAVQLRKKSAPLVADITKSETEFGDFLASQIRGEAESFQRVLQQWSNFKHQRPLSSSEDGKEALPTSFAVRFERRDLQFPTQNSKQWCRLLGDEFGALVCQKTGRSTVGVDLNDPDLEIMLECIRGTSEDTWQILSGIALPPPRQPTAHRRSERTTGRTSLRPERAYCLALLHPSLSPSTFLQTTLPSNSKALLFLDPCSGLGSIPIEVQAIARREGLGALCLAADNERPSLVNAKKNVIDCQLSPAHGAMGLDAGILWDGKGKGFSGGIRPGMVDGIVSDLPWGVRELSAHAINKLYPLLLRTLGDVCSDGAHAVLLSAKDKPLSMSMNNLPTVWALESKRSVDVNGIAAYVYTVRRKPRGGE